ncbi:uncharacterized protein LOC118756353, partial [Rhagoletis pomonella]|uniref:uncharacterized protein LOC118756353 n=1 Tax=Rhagoletis pomonella TaxID=28610 RepID=UPI001782A5DC
MITSSSSTSSGSSKLHQHSLAVNHRKGNLTTHTFKGDIQALHVTKKTYICKVCTKAEHAVRECPIFNSFKNPERKERVEKLQLCFNCLGYNHIASRCSSKRSCIKCDGRHHTLLHVEPTLESVSKASMDTAIINHRCATDTLLARKEVDLEQDIRTTNKVEVVLPTAIVAIDTFEGQSLTFRAFLDQGSEASFVTEHTVQVLRLPRKRAHINIKGLSEAKVAEARSYVLLTVRSRRDPSMEYRVLAYVLPKVNHVMPSKRITTTIWPYLKGLDLADPSYYEPQQVDILLGSDIYDECILSDTRRGPKGAPIAQLTTFGYIISGKVRNSEPSPITVSSLHNSIEFDTVLRKFWELEEVPEVKCSSSTVQRMESGKYIVRSPLLSEIDASSVIGTSRHMALKRFMHLENRLSRDPELRKTYPDTIREYLALGKMKPVIRSEQQSQCISKENGSFSTCFYLPHHPVLKESSSTTKIRIVFDASAKTSNGKSLNNILATGPSLQRNFSAVLTNWRFLKFVFTTDIEKMYCRIDVQEEDAQYQRILWRDNPAEEIKEYFCSVVMFGTASAPFTAIRTVQKLADDEGSNYPLAVDVIKHHKYADDILSGGHSIEEALNRQEHIIGMLKSGTFKLRKWASNHHMLLQDIPVAYRQLDNLLQLNVGSKIKTLGLCWNPKEDVFKYQINFEILGDVHTKRKILSTISRLFDPLGWLNPAIISAKIIKQRLWSLKNQLDSPVPDDIQRSWTQYIDELPAIEDISIPRLVNISNTIISSEIHIFCDALMHAHSAAAYLRVCDANGNYHSTLLMAKSKVAPIRPKLTIPRAELCGAVLATKILKFVNQELQICFSDNNIFFWTDSMIVLGWIQGDPHRWKLFIANRINKILEVSKPHIISADNPVDCSSRGLRPSKLVPSKLWWSGPEWLQWHSSKWPISRKNSDLPSSVKKELKSITVNAFNINTQQAAAFINNFSSMTQLIRVVANCRRFIINCSKPKSKRRLDNLSVEELDTSLFTITRIIQQDAFPSEWNALSMNAPLPQRSTLLPLNPFFDEEVNLIR